MAIRVYLSPEELRTAGAACLLVAVGANPLGISVVDAAMNDQMRTEANDFLARSSMTPTDLRGLGTTLIALAAGG
ncbi:MAG: hypothetical protein ABSF84_02820 [Acidimicrobiales bacterium]|jgi:hypothetical protein